MLCGCSAAWFAVHSSSRGMCGGGGAALKRPLASPPCADGAAGGSVGGIPMSSSDKAFSVANAMASVVRFYVLLLVAPLVGCAALLRRTGGHPPRRSGLPASLTASACCAGLQGNIIFA